MINNLEELEQALKKKKVEDEMFKVEWQNEGLQLTRQFGEKILEMFKKENFKKESLPEIEESQNTTLRKEEVSFILKNGACEYNEYETLSILVLKLKLKTPKELGERYVMVRHNPNYEDGNYFVVNYTKENGFPIVQFELDPEFTIKEPNYEEEILKLVKSKILEQNIEEEVQLWKW